MNNSKIAIDNVLMDEAEPVDVRPMLRQRETELVEVIEAIEKISSSNYWKVIQSKVFNPEFQKLQAQLINEKETIDLFRTQGKVSWMTNNLDLTKLLSSKRKELISIREKLND